LEREGAIGPADGAKPRDVLVSDPGMAGFSSQSGSQAQNFDTPPFNNYDDYEDKH
jgi:hypothetical protein